MEVSNQTFDLGLTRYHVEDCLILKFNKSPHRNGILKYFNLLFTYPERSCVVDAYKKSIL